VPDTHDRYYFTGTGAGNFVIVGPAGRAIFPKVSSE
jgi:hypothetical protein